MKHYDTPTAYIQLGWPVVPLHTPQSDRSCSCNDDQCNHIGKHPRVKDWQRCASVESDQIMRWWGTWPRANVGIVTGQRSGLLVLDVDTSDTPLARRLPLTPTVVTGHGFHYYFKHPGIDLPNAVRFQPDCDIRADGGLVVAPPSRHANGDSYSWLVAPDDLTPLADCPEWLIDAILESANKKAEANRSNGFAAPYPHPSQGGQPYALAAVERELAKVREALDGERNDQLNTSAFVLGTLLDAGQLDYDDVYQQLAEAGIAAGLSPGEAYGTAKSGLTAGLRKPREIAPPRRPDGSGSAPPSSPSNLAAPPAPDDLHNTDLGNAARFAAQHGHKLRYVPKWAAWLLWDGTRWQRDEALHVHHLARLTVRSMYAEASRIEFTDKRIKQVKWALATESKKYLDAMLALAKSEQGIPATPEQLDAEQHLLNCQNGTLDLQTGELRQHQQADLITKRIEVAYQPDAACPVWESFLARVMDNDQELITYIQRSVGYTLTGSTQEQCLFFAYGTGRNGKSTFFETLLALLGEYGQKAPTELIMARAPNTASNDIARLAGARMVVTAEIEEGRRLSESLVKDLTGGDTMVARFLYQELFEFTATHKLWVYGNHKPEIKGTDPGIWRRIRVIPFRVQIPREEVDPQLKHKLLAELPGIFAWAVRGCIEHQAHGLTEPEAVKQATQAYRSEMDVLAAFMRDCCYESSTAQAPVKELYKVYKQWCEDGGERAVTQRRLALQLNERGFDLYRSATGWVRMGMGLLSEDDFYSDHDPNDPKHPIFMTSHHEAAQGQSHENTDLGSLGSCSEPKTPENEGISTELPPLGREKEAGRDEGASIYSGLTTVQLSAEQWREARALYDQANFNALYKLASGWRVGYMKLVEALKSEGSNE